jgi:septum site-determining protein MinD
MTRFITVASGKGGVGKTTTAVNVASSLTEHGEDTVLVDGNLSTPHVHLHLGADVDDHLHDAIAERKHASELVHRHSSGLKLIPSLTELEHLKYPDYEGLKWALRDLDGHADTVVIDSSPGFSREACVSIEAGDELLIVCNPEESSVAEAKRSLDVARELNKTVLGIVVNKQGRDRDELSVDDIQDALDMPVIATVPYDDRVRKSWEQNHPVTHSHPRSSVARSFEGLACDLLGKEPPSFWQRLLHK